MIFLIVYIVIFIFVFFIFRRKSSVPSSIAKTMYILLLSLFIITISLLENYLSAKIGNQDGIAISNGLAYLIIGEDGWTVELFKNYYNYAMSATVISLMLYTISRLCENKEENKKI